MVEFAIAPGSRQVMEMMARNGALAQFELEVRQSKCAAKMLESAKITEVEPEKKPKKAKKAKKKAAKKATDGAKKQAKKAKTPAKKKTQD